MRKLKRSARLVDMTHYLLNRPHSLIPLTLFAERYQSAKSSISEDLAIIKEVLESEGTGELVTQAGAAGGVKYVPKWTSTNRWKKFAMFAVSWNNRTVCCLAAIYICLTFLGSRPC